jgi:hypothetical protein
VADYLMDECCRVLKIINNRSGKECQMPPNAIQDDPAAAFYHVFSEVTFA